MRKMATDSMTVKINPNDKGNPVGKLADAELHFTDGPLEGLKLAEGPQDVARLARLAGTKGGKTRAILKLAGRGAFALVAAAFDLFAWLFAAAWALFGFAASVKRITERATARYLRWRKAARARALAAAAMPAR